MLARKGGPTGLASRAGGLGGLRRRREAKGFWGPADSQTSDEPLTHTTWYHGGVAAKRHQKCPCDTQTDGTSPQCSKDSQEMHKELSRNPAGGVVADPENGNLQPIYLHIRPSSSKSTHTETRRLQVLLLGSVVGHFRERKAMISIRTSFKNYKLLKVLFKCSNIIPKHFL